MKHVLRRIVGIAAAADEEDMAEVIVADEEDLIGRNVGKTVFFIQNRKTEG
jgi:hypothetical protein